jgi:uncharacterized membrane protein YphA (DoxX/SURF4 family)
MPLTILRPAALMLAVVFAWAGVAKVLRWKTWRSGLHRYHMGRGESVVAIAVPCLELAVVSGLIAGRSLAASALTLALLAGFCVALLRARSAEGDRLPCNCFGGNSALDYKTMLLRNGILGIPAALILIGGKDFLLLDGLRGPTTGEAIPIALGAVGVVFVIWMVRVVVTLSGGRGE